MNTHEDPLIKRGGDDALRFLVTAFLAGGALASIGASLHWLKLLRRLPVPSELRYRYYNPFDVDIRKYITDERGVALNAAIHEEILNRLRYEAEKELLDTEDVIESRMEGAKSKKKRRRDFEELEEEEGLEKEGQDWLSSILPSWITNIPSQLASIPSSYVTNLILITLGAGAFLAGLRLSRKFSKDLLEKRTERYTRAYTQSAADAFYKEYADLVLLNKKMKEGAFDVETIKQLPEDSRKRIRDLLLEHSGLDYSIYLDLDPVAPELTPISRDELVAQRKHKLEPIKSEDKKAHFTKEGGFWDTLTFALAAIPAASFIMSLITHTPKYQKADPLQIVEEGFRKTQNYNAAVQEASQKIQNLINLNAHRTTNLRILKELLDPEGGIVKQRSDHYALSAPSIDIEETPKEVTKEDEEDEEKTRSKKKRRARKRSLTTAEAAVAVESDTRKITPARLRVAYQLLAQGE